MKTLLNQAFLKEKILKPYWQPLSSYRKRLVIGFLILLPFVAYFFMVWSPLRDSIAGLQDKISQDQKLLVSLRQASEKNHQINANKISKELPLLTLIQEQAKLNSWQQSPLNMKQIADNQVEVTFSQITFDNFVTGLEQLVNNFNISIERINLTRLNMSENAQVAVVLSTKKQTK